MRVIVIGAGGGSGRRIVEEALRAGHHVTAVVRDPEKFRALGVASSPDHDADHGDQAALAVERADVRDVESLAAVIAGHDVVVSAIGPRGRRADGLYSEGARGIVAAMDRCGVDRFLAITSAGVRHDDPEHALWYRLLVRPLLVELYADMNLMEQIVRDSDLEWTFVRPVLLLDRDRTGTYRVSDDATPARGRTITRGEVARFVVGELETPRWTRRAPTLAR